MKPIVSVVIPVYNGEKFIADALQSVLAQTVSDVEIIVIDDGSTDATRKVVESFGDAVMYRHQPNAGADRAYNHGISLARGEYIAFLDHDDRWYPKKLESQLAILARHPEVGLTYCEVECIDEHGTVVPRKTWAERRRITTDIVGDAATLLRRRMPVSVPAAMLFRREVLNKVGGFDCNFGRGAGHADGKLCVLAGEFSKIYFALKPLVQYRVHPNQSTHSRREQIHESRIVYLDSLWERWHDNQELRVLLLPLYGRYWAKLARQALKRGDLEAAARAVSLSLRYRPFNIRTWFLYSKSRVYRLFYKPFQMRQQQE